MPKQTRAVREAKRQQLLPNNTVDSYYRSNNPHGRFTFLDIGGGDQDYSVPSLLGVYLTKVSNMAGRISTGRRGSVLKARKNGNDTEQWHAEMNVNS